MAEEEQRPWLSAELNNMADEISVIGPGHMGIGITQVFLQVGYNVVLVGRSRESLDKGMERLKTSMGKAIKKGSLNEKEAEKMLNALHLSSDYHDIAGSILIIEAVSENFDIKTDVLKNAEAHANNTAIIATNTSSIPIHKLGNGLKNRKRFLGMHFFNPVPVMKPIELIISKETSEQAISDVKNIIDKLGKTPVMVNDYPGFIANRILMPFINEAIIALENGAADKEGIDTIAKLGFNHPMGPLELADFIGLDVCKDIMDSIYMETGNAKFIPSELLSRLVKEGKLGRKSGEGFYIYKK